MAFHIASTKVTPVNIFHETAITFPLFCDADFSHLEYFFNFDLFDVNHIFTCKQSLLTLNQ